MPLLSAIGAIEPAFERLKFMLFRPFRFKTWLKIGFIGWLAGGASGSFSVGAPPTSGGQGGNVGADVEQTVRAWMHQHILLIFLIVAFFTALALVLMYVSCRFRFILFDTVINRDARIRRSWTRYGGQALRFFGFLLSFFLIFGAAVTAAVGLPIWRAFTRGTFDSNDPMAVIRFVLLIILAAFVFAILAAVVVSLANDFGVPLLALDDLSIGDAWRELKQMLSAEPWAFAGYLGMKLVLSIAASAAVAIPFFIALLVLIIPGVILVLVGIAIAKALGPAAAVLLIVIGVLAALAILFTLFMLLAAPVAVFFTSYSLYFFGGRYPKLGALLWPQPPLSPAPPLPPVPPPPVPGMGSIA
jgi:hypothetical protein